MNISKNIKMSLSLIICAVMTGCGGYAPTDEEITEIRSFIEDLELVQNISPKANSNVQVPIIQTPVQVIEEESIEEIVAQVIDLVKQEQEEKQPEPIISSSPVSAGHITWEPANFYADGGTMETNEISHYEIVFGTSKDNLNKSVEVSVAGLPTYDFTAEAGHTWFVGVKTVSIYGSVSDISNLTTFKI